MEIGTVITFAKVKPDIVWLITHEGVKFVNTRTGAVHLSNHTPESLQGDIDNGFLRVIG